MPKGSYNVYESGLEENKVRAYDFELCTTMQGIFIQQLVAFAVMLAINIYNAFEKKEYCHSRQ